MPDLNPLQVHLINNFKQAVSLIKNSNIVFLEAGVCLEVLLEMNTNVGVI